ncbi:MAG: lactate utilization protein [Chloroflexi bacterium]|nr:lactate utilization protein [Chloroflexota bacterium]
MSRARDRILGRLRDAQGAHASHDSVLSREPTDIQRSMIPPREQSTQERTEQFIRAAEGLGSFVHRVGSPGEAVEQIMTLLDGDTRALAWDDDQLPILDLRSVLESLGVGIAAHNDDGARVGITGISAALAGTGSLVLESGAGRYRATSLLPDLHIALLTPEQILPDLESWAEAQRETGYRAFRDSSNTIIISGPSKTADIGHELVKGAHGPRELHILLLGD